MNGLAGKTIIVTGASSGIGKAVCLRLAQMGANVILFSRSEAAMKEVVDTIPAGSAVAFYADLLEPEKLHDVLDAAWSWHGGVDGLIHCAGIGGYVRLRDTDPEFMSRLMRVNCFSFVEIIRRLVRKKKKVQPFRAVAISSLVSSGHYKYFVAYAASKAALEIAAKAMSAELVKRNVAINVIQPAFVDTPMLSSIRTVIDMDSEICGNGYQPLGLIQPEEVANLAVFLMDDSNRHITGAVFPISGGAPC